MTTSSIGDGAPASGSLEADAGQRRSRGMGLKVSVLFLVCAGAIAWAGSRVWDTYHPVLTAVRGLRSNDPSRRAAAVREVSELGVSSSGEVIRAVLPVLADPEPTARAAGAETLGMTGTYALRSTSGQETIRAAVTTLTGLLKDPDAKVRAAAATALGLIAGTAAKPSRHGGGKSAESAAPPAPPVDPKAAAASLVDLLGDRDAAVRQAALSGLRDCILTIHKEPPAALLAIVEDEAANNRATAIGLLSTFPKGLDPVVPALLRHLEQDEPAVRNECSQALSRIPRSALSSAVVPDLIAGLNSRERDARLYLIRLLGRMTPDARAIVPALIKVLREPIESDQVDAAGLSPIAASAGPAQEAAAALGRLAPGTPMSGEAIKALTEVVQSGPRNRRAAAADALGRFGKSADQAVPALAALLQEGAAAKEPTEEAASAAEALGRIAPGTSSAAAATSALTASLKSQSAPVREAALEALKSFKPAAPDVIAAIRAVEKDDPSDEIRKSASSTLEAIQHPSK